MVGTLASGCIALTMVMGSCWGAGAYANLRKEKQQVDEESVKPIYMLERVSLRLAAFQSGCTLEKKRIACFEAWRRLHAGKLRPHLCRRGFFALLLRHGKSSTYAVVYIRVEAAEDPPGACGVGALGRWDTRRPGYGGDPGQWMHCIDDDDGDDDGVHPFGMEAQLSQRSEARACWRSCTFVGRNLRASTCSTMHASVQSMLELGESDKPLPGISWCWMNLFDFGGGMADWLQILLAPGEVARDEEGTFATIIALKAISGGRLFELAAHV